MTYRHSTRTVDKAHRSDTGQVTLIDSVSRLDEVLRALPAPFGPRRLRAAVPAADPLDDVPDGYAAFLRLADGAECGPGGEVRLWPARDVRANRWMADSLPGGPRRWCVIGDVLQNPICMDRATGQVWWFADPDIVWHTDTDLATFAEAAGDLAAFLDHMVLGAGYTAQFAAGPDDPWAGALTARSDG